MAYIQNPLEEDQNKQGVGVVQTSSANTNLSGDAGAQGTGDVGKDPTAGTGWTNLSKYLDANQGQATGMANDLTSGLNQAVDAFKGDATGGSATSQIMKASGKEQADAYASDIKGNAAAAKNFVNSSFSGGTKSDYTQPMKERGNQINGDLSALGDRSGQQGLLKDKYSKDGNQYTGGMAALDSFLTYGDQASRGQIEATKNRVGEVNDAYNGFENNVQNSLAGAQSAFEGNKQRVRDAAVGQYNAITQGAKQRAEAQKAADQANAAKQLNDIADKYNAYDMTRPGLLDGVRAQQGNYIKGGNYDASNYYSDADLEALNSLSQIDPSHLGAVQATQGSRTSVDSGAWDKMIKDAITNYDNAHKPGPAPQDDTTLGEVSGITPVVNAGKKAISDVNNVLGYVAPPIAPGISTPKWGR